MTARKGTTPPPRPPRLAERPCTKKRERPTSARTSRRLAKPGAVPEHYVPLAGAPEESESSSKDGDEGTEDFSFEKGLRALIKPDRASACPLLAGAVIDVEFDFNNPDVSIAAEIELEEKTHVFHACAATTLAAGPDLLSFKQALSGEDRPAWMAAMSVELETFARRGVWDKVLVDAPASARLIPLKWVLLIKRDEHGHVIKYKAQLVARGNLQRAGIDYGEVFSSTIRFSTILALLAMATIERWDVCRFDVTAAFLHGNLNDKHAIYTKQVPGFVDRKRPHAVRRLRRSLYGLRQASRKWNETFVDRLKSLGFSRSQADPSLFVRWTGD